MINDRRKFKRFDVSLGVEFKTSKESDRYLVGITKNFSRNGLCFESEAIDLSSKEPLELKVELPHQDTYVSVSGKVAWKEQFEDRCWIGIELRDMNKEAKSQILDYAYDQWVEKKRINDKVPKYRSTDVL
jgi:hypothetical protein